MYFKNKFCKKISLRQLKLMVNNRINTVKMLNDTKRLNKLIDLKKQLNKVF